MHRIAGLFVFALLAAGLGGSARESVAVAKTPPHATAVLAIVEAYNGSKLVWLDPATLRPLAKRSVALPGGAWSPIFSPAGRYVALGGPGSVGVRVVDVRRMKPVTQVSRRGSHRRLTPLAWPERHRLLVLDSPQDARGATEALLSVDPFERRLVGRTVRASSARAWRAWAPAGRELVVLSEPADGMGVVRIVVFGLDGGVLRAKDVGIAAGLLPEHGQGSVPHARFASPALAVDADGRRAFVVDPRTMAQVDLGTLDISYAQLGEPRSLASRLFSWLEPTAHAKFLSGYSRHATWLGDDLLVVTGSAYEGGRSVAAGLQIVDTTGGSVRMLDPRAAAHRFSQGILLAFGGSRDGATSAWTGMGLSAFTPDGARLWSTLGDEPVQHVDATGGYAYVPTPEEAFPRGVRIIDLETGRVVRTVRGEMPFFVVRD